MKSLKVLLKALKGRVGKLGQAVLLGAVVIMVAVPLAMAEPQASGNLLTTPTTPEPFGTAAGVSTGPGTPRPAPAVQEFPHVGEGGASLAPFAPFALLALAAGAGGTAGIWRLRARR